MNGSRLVLALSAVFAGMTALLGIGAVVSGSPVALFVALPLGVTSYFMYYHGSGRLARAVHRRAETDRGRSERGGFGAGPRSSDGPRTRFDREARSRTRRGRTRRGRTRRGSDPRDRSPRATSGPTLAEARAALEVGDAADEDEIERAYREKVKEVHPDRGGDEAEFKRVTEAYDRLSE